ncbi:MAG: hypothetical protein PHI90_04685, partial [Clostridia bacterium]|nr:hypothetical protein [Clostridia bacterium]
MYKILLICGGPSLERGISLNTTRSVYNNIGKISDVDIEVIFINTNMEKYIISQQFLYSNTPSDFDFKLKSEGKYLSNEDFVAELKCSDIVFPMIHGKYGEDGELQKLLESLNINFVGSGADSCSRMYNKEMAGISILMKNGFYTVPKLVVKRSSSKGKITQDVTAFFTEELKNVNAEVIVKPVEGGSSIGVEKTAGISGTVCTIMELFCRGDFDALLVELMCVGKEFTVIILENKRHEPTALIPTEIECSGVFTQEKKYMSSERTHYYCPPRFTREVIDNIRASAERLFSIAGARDFLRIDGWVLESGELYFSDFNPISGMEQNSFLFQQGAKIGLTHQGLICYILNNAGARYNINFLQKCDNICKKKKIYILMGGWTSERQVSLMSGTNVWLKLLNSDKYEATPFILFREQEKIKVLELPYAVALNHTVEEIMYQYNSWKCRLEDNKDFYVVSDEIRQRLQLDVNSLCSIELKTCISLDNFISFAKQNSAYVFLGLHGGFGEDGSIQKMLEDSDVPFNGSKSATSKICMDKFKTGQLVMELGLNGLRTARKKKLSISEMNQLVKNNKVSEYWLETVKYLNSDAVVIKPNTDGCSTGVIVLKSFRDFDVYLRLIYSHNKYIEPNTFDNQSTMVALSTENAEEYIMEEYILTGNISIKSGVLEYGDKAWVEMTVGVLERNGVYHSLNPSIAIAENAVLSVQEKFQGGIGVNITPPPEEIVSAKIIDNVKYAVEKVAEKLGIRDYCRIDIFVHAVSGEIIIIEANTLPGLSPSTVLFQQGVKEVKPILPLELL